MSISKSSSPGPRLPKKKTNPQQVHRQLFSPLPRALKEDSGRFEIFTLTDYSIPVYLGGSSGDTPRTE